MLVSGAASLKKLAGDKCSSLFWPESVTGKKFPNTATTCLCYKTPYSSKMMGKISLSVLYLMRLAWKRLPETKTLTYYIAFISDKEKSFITLPACVYAIKHLLLYNRWGKVFVSGETSLKNLVRDKHSSLFYPESVKKSFITMCLCYKTLYSSKMTRKISWSICI